MEQNIFNWHAIEPRVRHIAFRRYKGRRAKMSEDDYTALCNAMLPEDANKEMEGVLMPYHGIVMGACCMEAGEQFPSFLTFCYDGYVRLVPENYLIDLPWQGK